MLEKIYARIERLVLTFLGKKYVAWGVACWFLMEGKISGTDWILLTAAIFALDLVTKVKAPMNISATEGQGA